ncbi:unnamed protein product [Mytilus coruscus]|uniref:Endonuclease/exonuclease/phosphatase domain-containing protein n=1 Tax=Mytilus coruscus TaxID=42192 RepID=A0A6J8AL09_MYTCO|nr:unnamed protein product [Mytilus coruscus]
MRPVINLRPLNGYLQKKTFQDGFTNQSLEYSKTRRLGHNARPKRCLSTCPNVSKSLPISKILPSKSSISIQSSVLRSNICSSSLYKNSVRSGSLLENEKYKISSISGRLVNNKSTKSTSMPRSSRMSQSLGIARVHSEQGKVQTSSESEIDLFRGIFRPGKRVNIPNTGTNRQVESSHSKNNERNQSDSFRFSSSSGDNGLMYRTNSKCSFVHETNSAPSSLFLETSMSRVQNISPSDTTSQISSNLVITQSVCRYNQTFSVNRGPKSFIRPGVFSLTAWLLSTDLSKQRAFLKKLEIYSQLHGGKELRKTIVQNSRSTVAGVIGLIVFYILSHFAGALFIVCTLLLGIVLFCLSKITGQSGSTRRETDRELEKIITRLRKENDKYRQERDNTLQRLSPMTSLKHEKENLQSQIERQTRTTDNLLDEIAQLRIEQKIHQREKLQYADELYAEKDNSRRKCMEIERKWQESMDRSNKEIENVKTALFQQELESQMYRDQCTGLTERLREAMTEGHSIETQLQAARIDIQKEHEAYEEYKKSSKKTFDSMETEINKYKELLKKYGEFANKHKDSDRILQTSFAELEKIKKENNSLKSNKEIENVKTALFQQELESQMYRDQCTGLTERLREAMTEGHSIETQLQAARIDIQKEHEAYEEYKKSSKKTFDSMETEINKYKELLKKYGEFANKHKDSDRILQTSFAELEKIKKENNSLKLENSNLNKRVIDLGKESEVPQCSICMERERNAYMDPCGHTLCMVRKGPNITDTNLLMNRTDPVEIRKKSAVIVIICSDISHSECFVAALKDVLLGQNRCTPKYEYISPSKYTIYTKNRKDGYGGVLLAITNTLITSHVPELDTDCELIWAKITPTGNKTTYLGAYYRPPSDKGESLEHLSTSLNRICNISSANIMLSGDFNLGNIDWSNSSVIPSKPDPSLHQHLLDILQDHNLTQVVDKPTRNDRTLDLLCMSNPSLVNRVETLPPLGDHDIIFSEINLSLSKAKQSPQSIHLQESRLGKNWKRFKRNILYTYGKTHIRT